MGFSNNQEEKAVINQQKNQNYYPIVVTQSNPLQLQNDVINRVLAIEEMQYESQAFKGI